MFLAEPQIRVPRFLFRPPSCHFFKKTASFAHLASAPEPENNKTISVGGAMVSQVFLV